MLSRLVSALALALAASVASSSAQPPATVPLGPLPRVVTPLHYRLDFTIDPAKDRFSGHDEIAVTFR